MKIEVWSNSAGAWFWHFVARNGKTVADAESFPSKANAIRAAKACVKGIARPYFNWLAPIKFEATEQDGRTTMRWS